MTLRVSRLNPTNRLGGRPRLTGATVDGRRCTKCNEFKPWAEFYAYGGTCRPCNKIRCRENYAANREARRKRCNAYYYMRKEKEPEALTRMLRRYELRSLYGLEIADYERMVDEQDGLCAVCKKPPRGKRPRLFVDHDHETDVVRALLCSECNLALGLIKDSPTTARRAAEYLEKWGR